MNLFGEFGHDLGRVRQILRVMAEHGFAPALKKIPMIAGKVPEVSREAAAAPAGMRFCRMLEELGPTFVKVGQILSTRADLLPPEFIRALSKLQDDVPPFPFDQVKEQVEAGLGQGIEDLFLEFAEAPLASASMAQVHAAKLKDGADVVVKVQRPGIGAQIERDSHILILLARLLELVVEEASTYHAVDLAEEFQEGLGKELVFSGEAINLRTFARMNEGRHGIKVPNFYPELSCATILTMARICGRRITDMATDRDADELANVVERFVKLGFDHVFQDGIFHADPHPGNVLLTDDDEIAFIDFGLMGKVARDAQDRLLTIQLALGLRDADSLARLLIRLGDPQGRVNLQTFRDAIRRVLDKYLGLAISEIDTGTAFNDLLDLALRFGIRMPREFALLAKASVAIEGIVRALHPNLNVSGILSARAEHLMMERLDPRQFASGGMRTALQLATLVQDMPLQLNQVLIDLERGQLQVAVVSEEMQSVERTLRGLGMTVFTGLFSSALLLGGFYALGRYPWQILGVELLPLIAFSGASILFGAALATYLSGGPMPKLKLENLAKKRRRSLPKGPNRKAFPQAAPVPKKEADGGIGPEEGPTIPPPGQ
jgi:ubiquinone biosynthesis protein